MGYMKDLLITVYGGGDEAVAAAEKLAGLTRWIPVSERLPEEERVVLIAVRGSVGMARLYSDGWYWDIDEWHKPFTPTHWMPLPEPPEVK